MSCSSWSERAHGRAPACPLRPGLCSASWNDSCWHAAEMVSAVGNLRDGVPLAAKTVGKLLSGSGGEYSPSLLSSDPFEGDIRMLSTVSVPRSIVRYTSRIDGRDQP